MPGGPGRPHARLLGRDLSPQTHRSLLCTSCPQETRAKGAGREVRGAGRGAGSRRRGAEEG